MSRHIYCRQCHESGIGVRTHPEDLQRGITMRSVWIAPRVPEGYQISIHAEGRETRFCPLNNLHCDMCDAVLNDVARAVTFNPPGREVVPWEDEYGNVLTDEQVAILDKLKGETNE